MAITDGRGNVPLSTSWASPNWRARRSRSQAEVLDVAARYRMLGIKLLVIDTEHKFIGNGMGETSPSRSSNTCSCRQAIAIAAVAMNAIGI